MMIRARRPPAISRCAPSSAPLFDRNAPRAKRARDGSVVEQQIGDEGVGLALPAEGRGLAVARHELDVVAEWPESLADGREKLLVVAAREVGAADRAAEQHVADEGELRRLVHEHDMARRLARAVHNVEGE